MPTGCGPAVRRAAEKTPPTGIDRESQTASKRVTGAPTPSPNGSEGDGDSEQAA